MLFRRKHQSDKKRHHAWLYSVVFRGHLSMLAILLLFTSFLIQPFHQAMAAEPLPPPPEPVVADDVREQVEEESPPVAESPPEEESPPPEEIVVAPETPETEPAPGDLDVPEEGVDEGGGSGAPEPETPPTEEVQEEDEEDTENVDQGDGATGEVANNETNTDATTDDDEEEEEEEIQKESKEEMVVQVESLVTEENFYQFSKQSCVAVGDGTYHCTTKTSGEIDTQSVVYSDKGEDGSLEIFLRTSKGKVKQLTDNAYDDTAPHYDPESMRVVWQRLIDGRQQIVLFDIVEDKEAQLTFSKTNNMEPKVSESGIVWQAWDGNDWEVMFFDGSYTEQITDNESQDVAPVIQDGYILWNVLGGEEEQARVYSLDTKETISIEGYDGGTIANPRFVLVYDTMYENGDIITQTFDPATGLSEPVAAKAAPEPVNIPQTDPTGEIRALINNKSQKDEAELEDVPTGDTADTTGAATTTPGTLNLKSGDNTTPTTTITAPLPEFTPIELTEYDLVIPQSAFEDALAATSSTQE